MASGKIQAVLSLHDVMPESLERVREIIALTHELGIPPYALLVVPGRKWSRDQIDTLHAWAKEGYELAAHGWIHHVSSIRGLRHRLHAALLSRHVAEHMALPPEGIIDLMRRSRDWFGEQGLPTPRLYVPPAWALGRAPLPSLRQTGFRLVEVFGGFVKIPVDAEGFATPKGVLPPVEKIHLPLMGFEADTLMRQVALKAWNRFNCQKAARTGLPVRISIHPEDLRLRMGEDLRKRLRQPFEWISSEAAAGPYF